MLHKAANNSRSSEKKNLGQFDRQSLSLVGHFGRAVVIQCKNYETCSLCANMVRFNFITGPQYQLA